jgi:hypothetical protein
MWEVEMIVKVEWWNTKDGKPIVEYLLVGQAAEKLGLREEYLFKAMRQNDWKYINRHKGIRIYTQGSAALEGVSWAYRGSE